MINNPFGIKAKAPLCITAAPGEVTLVFNRICGWQIHHEILSLENFGNFQIGVNATEDSGSEPPPSVAYYVGFPRDMYDPNHVATRIAERLESEHGIESIVKRHRPDKGDDEGPANVLISVR